MLTIANLSKTYRGQRILDRVNWFAPDRTRIGLTGMNGAGKCWVTTDPFRESTVLLCEFSYPARGNRHAVIARLDPVWHDAVSSLAAPFLEEEGSLDAGSAMGLARRLGADLREVPSAEAAGLLRAGLGAFTQHGPAPWAERDSQDYRTTLGLASRSENPN